MLNLRLLFDSKFTIYSTLNKYVFEAFQLYIIDLKLV